MLTNTMEVDCSLDEFAKALAENGYINDESCFADLPSMLSAFETADVLNSSDSFPESPYSHDDLTRVLEIAQMASTSLFDSCLPENFPYPKSIHALAPSIDVNSNKTRDPCISNMVLNESLHNLSTVLSCRDATLSSKNNSFVQDITSDAVSLNLFEAKENDVLKSNDLHLPQPLDLDTPSNHGTCYLWGEYHQSSRHQSALQTQSPSYLSSHSDTVTASTEQRESEVSVSSSKHKRKRKSKGYSRPAKSKRRKNRNTSESQPRPQPKPKKARTSKDNGSNVTIKDSQNAILSSSAETHQDDSGFESGEKTNSKVSVSLERASHASASTPTDTLSSEQLTRDDESQSLRRSCRTVRNPENYNFRLSSLVKRVETERRQQEPRQPKDKSKPPPLSKYRRRTANARERDRMKDINDAFDMLKDSLPDAENDEGKQKLTKFSILKLALNYIASLREMLGYDNVPSALDDDVSCDLSSLWSASVTSVGSEDSCSSPTSGPASRMDQQAQR